MRMVSERRTAAGKGEAAAWLVRVEEARRQLMAAPCQLEQAQRSVGAPARRDVGTAAAVDAKIEWIQRLVRPSSIACDGGGGAPYSAEHAKHPVSVCTQRAAAAVGRTNGPINVEAHAARSDERADKLGA